VSACWVFSIACVWPLLGCDSGLLAVAHVNPSAHSFGVCPLGRGEGEQWMMVMVEVLPWRCWDGEMSRDSMGGGLGRLHEGCPCKDSPDN
jgi:hypothetical protein